MTTRSRWLLPDGVDEQLPPEAARLEMLRRQVLDVFRVWGYRLCIPPQVEFLDSLLSGIGEDLELQTFKLTDQVSGRMLGVPADMTPQVARIDAHRLPTEGPQRLCYLGPVLHTVPDKFAGSRNPLQVGAELYGHAGIESDGEIICLMLAVLHELGIDEIILDLGHMQIFRGLVNAAGLDHATEHELRESLLRKSGPDTEQILRQAGVSATLSPLFRALVTLSGGVDVLTRAARELAAAPATVREALSALTALVKLIGARRPEVEFHIDLAELRGYHYHTGPMFGAYTRSQGRVIAWGGRYDNIGAEFGRARPATGFSADLKLLSAICPHAASLECAIYAPHDNDPTLIAEINRLRHSGRIVIQALPTQVGGARELGCQESLSKDGATWQVGKIEPKKD